MGNNIFKTLSLRAFSSLIGITSFFAIGFASHAGEVRAPLPADKDALVFASELVLQDFLKNYEDKNGQPLGGDLVGFDALYYDHHNIEVFIFSEIEFMGTAATIYDCHFHGSGDHDHDHNHGHKHHSLMGSVALDAHKELHCQRVPEGVLLENYQRTADRYEHGAFKSTLDVALRAMSRQSQGSYQVKQLSLWQADRDIFGAFEWHNLSNSSDQTMYLKCHGANIHCHREAQIGPNQPKL